jgi:hypothetical protein
MQTGFVFADLSFRALLPQFTTQVRRSEPVRRVPSFAFTKRTVSLSDCKLPPPTWKSSSRERSSNSNVGKCATNFKVYKSQIPVIERAIETAALMLGTDKSRGYCLEMICADFLAGAHLDNGNPDILLNSISRYYKFLPGEQQQAFLESLREKAS